MKVNETSISINKFVNIYAGVWDLLKAKSFTNKVKVWVVDYKFWRILYWLPQTVTRSMLYPKYEYRLITYLVYAKKYNCYFALGKDFSLKVSCNFSCLFLQYIFFIIGDRTFFKANIINFLWIFNSFIVLNRYFEIKR